MNILKFLIIFSAFIVFVSFLKVEESDDPRIALGKHLEEISNYAKYKYKFIHIGTSVSFPSNSFKSAGLSFMVYHQISKNELYKILYDISTKLLIEINSDEKLHKYMTNFPFELENISIIVFFQESPGKLFYHPNLDVASLSYGTYNFSTVKSENENCYESEIHEKFDINLIK